MDPFTLALLGGAFGFLGSAISGSQRNTQIQGQLTSLDKQFQMQQEALSAGYLQKRLGLQQQYSQRVEQGERTMGRLQASLASFGVGRGATAEALRASESQRTTSELGIIQSNLGFLGEQEVRDVAQLQLNYEAAQAGLESQKYGLGDAISGITRGISLFGGLGL